MKHMKRNIPGSQNNKKKGKKNNPYEGKNWWQKTWYFIWEDDSILSWLVNIVIAFILVKYIVYPVLGLIFATTHPIVAVVSSSMEHPGNFDEWWNSHLNEDTNYSSFSITKQDFYEYPFKNGFNKGDIMILRGKDCSEIKLGEVLIFWGRDPQKPDPIIHRVIKTEEKEGVTFLSTKGDNNMGQLAYEINIPETQSVGYKKYQKCSIATIRIPFLGYIKIGAVKFISLITGNQIIT
jgi:signal peptidase I